MKLGNLLAMSFDEVVVNKGAYALVVSTLKTIRDKKSKAIALSPEEQRFMVFLQRVRQTMKKSLSTIYTNVGLLQQARPMWYNDWGVQPTPYFISALNKAVSRFQLSEGVRVYFDPREMWKDFFKDFPYELPSYSLLQLLKHTGCMEAYVCTGGYNGNYEIPFEVGLEMFGIYYAKYGDDVEIYTCKFSPDKALLGKGASDFMREWDFISFEMDSEDGLYHGDDDSATIPLTWDAYDIGLLSKYRMLNPLNMRPVISGELERLIKLGVLRRSTPVSQYGYGTTVPIQHNFRVA